MLFVPSMVYGQEGYDMNLKFTIINVEKWSRGQMFYYFSKMAPTGYSLTIDLDITILKAALKASDIKFFPAYLWLVTKVLDKQLEFKVAEIDDVLGYWDALTPLYATFHEDDKTISFMWTEYNDNFKTFYNNYLDNQEKYSGNHGVLSQNHCLPPPNSYIISCLPWLEFKHFSFHSFENKAYYFPTVEVGRFYENNGKILLPFSITVHHATTDGWHVKNFLGDLQNEMNSPELWIK